VLITCLLIFSRTK